MLAKLPRDTKIEKITPITREAIGIGLSMSKDIIGVKKNRACTPNREDSMIELESSKPNNHTNHSDHSQGTTVITKNRLVTISENNRGVKELVRGPMDNRENHIGVNKYIIATINAILLPIFVHMINR